MHMPENWLILIPKDPNTIPDEGKRKKGRARLLELFPKSKGVKIITTNAIVFYDCGSNLERIICPKCKAKIPIPWWQERMDADYSKNSFKLDPYLTPCCQHSCTLNELIYEGNQGFGRCAIEVMEPDIPTVEKKQISELEGILGTELSIIYQLI
jgi:hypothetical protein